MSDTTPQDTQAVDLDALKQRYRLERDRRAPGKVPRGYLDMRDGFTEMLDDP